MRKLLFGVAMAVSALAISTPASAQYHPYGRGSNLYSQNVYGIENRIRNVLGSINSAPYGQQDQLRSEALRLDRQVRYAAQRGIDPWAIIGNRLEQLEIQVQQATARASYGYERRSDYYDKRHEHRHRSG